MGFNLLDEPWIPVLYRNGNWTRVGVVAALADAAEIREIAASNPMDRVAILRFLLGLVYWCKGNPRPENGSDSFDLSSSEMLSRYREQFNIFSSSNRVFQVQTAKRPRPASDLLQELPTGNNFWHFRHSLDDKDGLCAACCALGLLRLPLFSVSGLPDLKAGINGTPPVYAIPYGLTLEQTLKLNWLPRQAIGEPSWVNPELPTSGEIPLLPGLTSLSRRVWLHSPILKGETCVNCGVPGPLVYKCEFQSAGSLKSDDWCDPHVVYQMSSKRKAMVAPDLTASGRFRLDKPWAELLSQLVEQNMVPESSGSVWLQIVGFATDKAKNIDVWERTFQFGEGEALPSPDRVRAWDKDGRQLEKRLCRSQGLGRAVTAACRPHVESVVSNSGSDYLLTDDMPQCDASSRYNFLLAASAHSLTPGVSAEAVQERRRVKSLMSKQGEQISSKSSARRKEKVP